MLHFNTVMGNPIFGCGFQESMNKKKYKTYNYEYIYY